MERRGRPCQLQTTCCPLLSIRRHGIKGGDAPFAGPGQSPGLPCASIPTIAPTSRMVAVLEQYRPDWKSRSEFRPMKLLVKYELERFQSGWKRSNDVTENLWRCGRESAPRGVVRAGPPGRGSIAPYRTTASSGG